MDTKTLVKLTSRAWSLDILALMHSGVPGRQAALVSASGAGRTALVQSLRHLIDIGLLERNPGHGHPLRPEYRLTSGGVEAAIVADRVKKTAPEPASRSLLRRAWTVPVLAVSREPLYFTDIKFELESISDRALSQTLKQLLAHDWLKRTVDPEVIPSRPLYRAAAVGARISRAIGVDSA